MRANDFSIEPVKDGAGGVRLLLSGELDLAYAPELTAAIEEHSRPGATLIVDLGGLRFIDSSGLAALLAAQEAAERDGWEMAVTSVPEPVDRVFEITDTRRMLKFV